MNSLHELNDYGDEELITTDERATILTWAAVAGYDGSTALTQTQDEGASLVMKLGYDATFMQSIPDTFVYIIDVSYAGGNVTPTWNSLPDGVTVTSAANVYTVHGIRSLSQWNAVKQPSMILAANYSSNYNYDVSISYDNSSNNYFWIVQVTVSNLSEVTTINPATLTFNQDQTLTFGAAVPNITDAENTSATYVMTLDLSDNSAGTLDSNYYSSALTTSFTSGTLTLTGSRTLINNYLNQLIFIPAPAYATSFTIAYILTSASVTLAQFSQSINVGTTHTIISNMGLNRTYYKNTAGYLFASSIPTIIETVSYTNYSVSLQFATNIGFLGLGESVSAPVGWDSGSLTYTFTGTKAQTQTVLNTLRFFSVEGQTTNSTITFRLIRDGTIIATSAILLSGTNTSVFSGGDGNQTINENATATFSNPAVVYPHWSTAFTITFRQLNSAGSAPYAAGVFGAITGATTTATTLTKTYTPALYHDHVAINAEIAALNIHTTIALGDPFKLQTDFSYDNSSINYTATKSITVIYVYQPVFTGSGFYKLDSAGNYTGTTPVTERYWNEYVYFDAYGVGVSSSGNDVTSLNYTFDTPGQTVVGIISSSPDTISTAGYTIARRLRNYYKVISWAYYASQSNSMAGVNLTATTSAGISSTTQYGLRTYADKFEWTGAVYNYYPGPDIQNTSLGSRSGNTWTATGTISLPFLVKHYPAYGYSDKMLRTANTGGLICYSDDRQYMVLIDVITGEASGINFNADDLAHWRASTITITVNGITWFHKPAAATNFSTYSRDINVSAAFPTTTTEWGHPGDPINVNVVCTVTQDTTLGSIGSIGTDPGTSANLPSKYFAVTLDWEPGAYGGNDLGPVTVPVMTYSQVPALTPQRMLRWSFRGY